MADHLIRADAGDVVILHIEIHIAVTHNLNFFKFRVPKQVLIIFNLIRRKNQDGSSLNDQKRKPSKFHFGVI